MHTHCRRAHHPLACRRRRPARPQVRRLRIQLRLRGASEDPGEMSVVEEAYPSTIPFFPPVTERTIQAYTRFYVLAVMAIIGFGGILAPSLEVRLGIGGEVGGGVGRWSVRSWSVQRRGGGGREGARAYWQSDPSSRPAAAAAPLLLPPHPTHPPTHTPPTHTHTHTPRQAPPTTTSSPACTCPPSWPRSTRSSPRSVGAAWACSLRCSLSRRTTPSCRCVGWGGVGAGRGRCKAGWCCRR